MYNCSWLDKLVILWTQFTETQNFFYVSLLYLALFAFNNIFVHLGTVNKYVSHLAAFWPFRGRGLHRGLLTEHILAVYYVAIITCNNLSFFNFFSNFVHFWPNFQIFCSFQGLFKKKKLLPLLKQDWVKAEAVGLGGGGD